MVLLPPKSTMKNWSLIHKSFYEFVKLVLPRFMRVFFRFEVNGINNVNQFPEGTPVLFCANHRSNLDVLIFASALVHPFGNRRACGFMASGKAMQNPFLELVKYLGGFPVYPENPDPALNHAFKLLKERYAVFMAPQGKRIPSNPLQDYHNLLNEGKSGIGRLVLRYNGKIPVVPMYIHGSREALTHGKVLPKFKSFISVSICKPLFFSRYARREGWSDLDPTYYKSARRIVNTIMTSIRNQMLIQEKQYFKVLERKFRVPIEKIHVSVRFKPKIIRFLFNLSKYHPEELKEFLEAMH